MDPFSEQQQLLQSPPPAQQAQPISQPTPRHQHMRTPSQSAGRWVPSPLNTPPPPSPLTPNIPPSLPSHNTSFRSTASTNVDEYDSTYGYPSVGLGISQATKNPNFSGPALEPYSQDSPRFLDTPKITFQAHERLLGGSSPGTPSHRMERDYSQSPPPKAKRRKWRWKCSSWEWTDSPWIMYALLLFGIVVAIGHHIFYSHLAGKPADDQLKMMRFGTLLAYVAKSSLVSAVIFAYRQNIWATVRRKSLKLRTIDNLFSAVDDFRSALSMELIKKARVALALAIICWYV